MHFYLASTAEYLECQLAGVFVLPSATFRKYFSEIYASRFVTSHASVLNASALQVT
jgi:hypothetical protein